MNEDMRWLFSAISVTIFAVIIGGVMLFIHKRKYGYFFMQRKKQNTQKENVDPVSNPSVPKPKEEQTLFGYPIRESTDTHLELGETPIIVGGYFVSNAYQDLKLAINAVPEEDEFVSHPETREDDLSIWEDALDDLSGLPKKHPILDMPIGQRKHTILVGATGDGKTQAQIAMMIKDIKRSAEVFWMNPDLALYNEKDQPTDLRPIQDRFTQVFEYNDILRHLQAFVQVINDRKPHYRNNEPVGHTIVAYLDEWPSIVQVCGDLVVQALQVIAREGRKVDVYLCVASQDALVDTMGIKSGVRAQFNTRLVASCDRASWTALMGTGVPMTAPEGQGNWSWSEKVGKPIMNVHINPATKTEISGILSTGKLSFPLLPDINEVEVLSSIEDDIVASLLENDPSISDRAIARTLWPHSRDGGGRYAQEARKIRDRVLLLRVTDSPESGLYRTGNSVTPVTVTVTPDGTPPVTSVVTLGDEHVTPTVTPAGVPE